MLRSWHIASVEFQILQLRAPRRKPFGETEESLVIGEADSKVLDGRQIGTVRFRNFADQRSNVSVMSLYAPIFIL
jgi:hypothetical protein